MEAQRLVRDAGNAAKLDFSASQMASDLGILRDLLGEVDEIGDRGERIINLVGDGTGQSTHGVELF
jgi:hypothetical protein